MEKYLINGGKKLEGTVKLSGAKNSALKLMAASLLCSQKVVLKNIPEINDVFTMAKVLKEIGTGVRFYKSSDKSIVEIDTSGINRFEASYELVSQMRASIIVLGPLLARFGRAKVALPGGCNIGSRKIDLHLFGLELLGAKIEVEHGFIEAKANSLHGTLIPLSFPSVGATENVMMAATLANGTTIIENAAREPEIVDLADFLNKAGAKIKGAGTSTIEIGGVNSLKPEEHAVIPDRIEAGTFIMAGILTGGNVTVENACCEHLKIVLAKLKEAGAWIKEFPDKIRVSSRGLKSVNAVTLPYPGFPTDLQAPMAVLLSLADGTSIITENVFESRFMVVDELNRMGADLNIHGHHLIVKGVGKLSGTTVCAPDLRGGAALVLAGLAAKGKTEVLNIFHIDRGYENFDKKLRLLGADIERVKV